MTIPEKACDLVMKGGITSGVVYPKAVQVLSKEYRFSQIGGTSAGAIAAVVTAAAEYGREKGGFEKVAELSKDLSENLLVKFQPSPCVKPLFALTIAAISKERKIWAIAGALLSNFGGAVLGGVLIGLIFALLSFINGGWFTAILAGLATGIIALAVTLFLAIRDQIMNRLPNNDYGMCKGRTQVGYTKPALTDWLTDIINDVAGLGPDDPPLTVKQLKESGITVKTVTTDIVSRRPYTLPIANDLYAFSKAEFQDLFPERVVEAMTQEKYKVSDKWGKTDLYKFSQDEIPVVVLARLSLSFPGLISAVPLYRVDWTLKRAEGAAKTVRCLFSDGGLSSNFPVHFFDEFLPGTPTFGISLGEYDVRRIDEKEEQRPDKGRVSLPVEAGEGRLIRTTPFDGIGAFIMALFNSAKDWQDTLQTVLPGYRERIVSIDLTAEEGGLNLTMTPKTIEFLGDMGEFAGKRIREKFDFDEHRWRRYLVEQNAVEDLLIKYHDAYTAKKPYGSDFDYAGIAVDYERKSYTDISPARRKALQERSQWISDLGKRVKEERATRGIDMMDWEPEGPKSNSTLRNIADMD